MFTNVKGDVAHMVERSLRMREARGSIPRVSSFAKCTFFIFVWHSFIDSFDFIDSNSSNGNARSNSNFNAENNNFNTGFGSQNNSFNESSFNNDDMMPIDDGDIPF